VLVLVYHLIILLRAHSRNLRHNNIGHREIVGSSPGFYFLRWTTIFLCVRGFFFHSVVHAHNDRGVCQMFVNM
jgi:hypothetical protein